LETFKNGPHGFLQFLFVVIVLLLSGCRPHPSIQTVSNLVIHHFETEKYHVIALEVGDITSLSPGEKTYMGTPGYLVDIRSITLEMRKDIGSPVRYRQGQQVTFRNAEMKIKEQPGQTRNWIITGISGIPVP
jgi:hypothetical protein